MASRLQRSFATAVKAEDAVEAASKLEEILSLFSIQENQRILISHMQQLREIKNSGTPESSTLAYQERLKRSVVINVVYATRNAKGIPNPPAKKSIKFSFENKTPEAEKIIKDNNLTEEWMAVE